MSQFLTVPAECRLRIYGWYLNGIDPCITVHLSERDRFATRERSEPSRTLSFVESRASAHQASREVSLSLLGVCRVVRRELLPFLAASVPLRIQFHLHESDEDLPLEDVRFLENGYGKMVREMKPYAYQDFGALPLVLFPSVKSLSIHLHTHESLENNNIDGEQSLDVLRDECALAQVRDQARQVHARYKETIGLDTGAPGCSLETIIDFGSFCVDISTSENNVRQLMRTFCGFVLVGLFYLGGPNHAHPRRLSA